MSESLSATDDECLTTYDVQQGGAVHFSACLIYDVQSRGIVTRFLTKMNEINEYLIFFDPYWDILPGSYENDALAQIIETRCDGKVLVFLPETDNFTNPKMEFALHYAKHLDISGRKRHLVPVYCHNTRFSPNVLKGLTGIHMNENDNLTYWVQQSKQFRPSFSPKGPLRKECFLYKRSLSYPFTGRQYLEMSTVSQYEDSHSSRPTTYPLIGISKAENGEPAPMVKDSSLHTDNGSHSVKDESIQTCTEEIQHVCISYQNDSFPSSQSTIDESNLYPNCRVARGHKIRVSYDEIKDIQTTNSTEVDETNTIKDKWNTKIKKWIKSVKRKAE